MVDPLSGAVLTGVAMTEGIKFLYAQAGELLKWWRQRREGKEAPEPLLEPPTGLLEGQLRPASPDFGQVDRVEPDLRELLRQLSTYASGVDEPDAADNVLREQADAVRRALEVIYGQRITFAGERREPSGAVIDGRAVADQVFGDLAAVRAKTIRSGEVRGDFRAKTVMPGARGTGVDVDTVG